MWGLGVGISKVTALGGEPLALGAWWLSLPVTVGWPVVCAIAVDLIDGMEGLASGISMLVMLTMLVLAMGIMSITPTPPMMLVVVLLAGFVGAVGGFLLFNFNPAVIFLGDLMRGLLVSQRI